jgi:hypothetical protein
VNIDLVAPADVDRVWPLIRDDVANCLIKTPGGGYAAGDYWTLARSGNIFLIIAHDGADLIASTFWRFEDDLFVCLMLAGKHFGLWARQVLEFAQAMAPNCKLVATGRTGFDRALKKQNIKTTIVRQTYLMEV